MSAFHGSRESGPLSERAPRPRQIARQPEADEVADAGTSAKGHDLVGLQRAVGNRGVQALLNTGGLSAPIQAKLTVGEADDAYEQEADRVAHDVMTMPDGAVQREDMPEDELAMSRIQREDMPEDELPLARIQREDMPEDELPLARIQREDMPEDELPLARVQREDMPEDELPLARVQRAATPEVTTDAESQIESMRGGGQALPDSAREFFEPRFGQDFSGVNVHTGPEADSLNRSLDARAFATGGDIFFRSGEYNPDSSGGRELLAHELTHVVQQGASPALDRKTDESE
jgi:hypothetical protein